MVLELNHTLHEIPSHRERRRQSRGLLWLALAAIAFAILRFGVHRVFTHGWWHLW